MAGKSGVIALLGAAVAGPASAIVWPALIKWPVVIGYEIALLLVGLVGSVATDWTKLLVPRITNWLDKALGRKFTRFYKRYRQYVLSDLRVIDLKGLTTIGFYNPELDEVFVDVSLAYRSPHQAPSGLLSDLPKDATERHSISDFLNRKQPVVLAVLGAPGSGKTTLLRHTARRVFERKSRSVPVLLYLRDHVSHIGKNHKVSLPELIRETLSSHIDAEPPGWFDQKLKQGECVVLLDGLDEVAKQEDRRLVADWVELQTKRYPNNDFVLTSRPHGYQSTPIQGATALQVRSFTDEQVQKFIHGWYVAVIRHTTNRTADEAARVADSQTRDLLDRLNKSVTLIDLTVNPLLLTMIANVHHYRGALPGSRAELYQEICQVMLWRRQEAKKLPAELDGSKKETLLRGLAFAMMQRKVRDLPEQEVLAEIDGIMRRVSRRVTANDFLSDVSSNGLLVERESGQYSFAHLTFQEFLAASHIREKGLAETLADNVDDIWWRETTLLYAAKSDADTIVRACLKSGTGTALSLAFDCAEQDSELDPDLHVALKNVISQALAPCADADLRNLAATVLLTRHLRQVVRVSPKGQVCPSPITNKIFHLFRQDVRGPLPVGPTPFVPDDNPVVGVRRRDASTFYRWATDKTGVEYRLPTEAELVDPAVQRALGGAPSSVWTHGSTLWTSPHAVHPLVIERDTLVAHLDDDFRQSSATVIRLLVFKAILACRKASHPRADELTAALLEVLSGMRAPDLNTRYDVDHATSVAIRAETLHPEEFLDLLIEQAHQIGRAVVATELDHLLSVSPQSVLAAATGVVDHHLPVSFAAMATVAGWAMTESVERLLSQGGALSTHFANHTRVPDTELVDLDEISLFLQRPHKFGPNAFWAAHAAERFGKAALSIFRWKQQLTPSTATALRLTALCLATEQDNHGKPWDGDAYRKVAAGVTLLQRRASGQSPMTETIILATG